MPQSMQWIDCVLFIQGLKYGGLRSRYGHKGLYGRGLYGGYGRGLYAGYGRSLYGGYGHGLYGIKGRYGIRQGIYGVSIQLLVSVILIQNEHFNSY